MQRGEKEQSDNAPSGSLGGVEHRMPRRLRLRSIVVLLQRPRYETYARHEFGNGRHQTPRIYLFSALEVPFMDKGHFRKNCCNRFKVNGRNVAKLRCQFSVSDRRPRFWRRAPRTRTRQARSVSQRVAQEMCSAASSFEQGSVRKVVGSLNRLHHFSKYVQQKMSDHKPFDEHVLDGTWRDLKQDLPIEFAPTPTLMGKRDGGHREESSCAVLVHFCVRCIKQSDACGTPNPPIRRVSSFESKSSKNILRIFQEDKKTKKVQ